MCVDLVEPGQYSIGLFSVAHFYPGRYNGNGGQAGQAGFNAQGQAGYGQAYQQSGYQQGFQQSAGADLLEGRNTTLHNKKLLSLKLKAECAAIA